MKPVPQEKSHPTKGDCLRASIASLFELELSQVPHFRLFSSDRERYILSGFYWGMGYNWIGCGKPGNDQLLEHHSVNGFFEACVPSSYGPNASHSVIIDIDGTVIHDPHPQQPWKGKNVLESGDLKWWTMVEKNDINSHNDVQQ